VAINSFQPLLVYLTLRYKNVKEGGFLFYMIREKVASFFYLRPKNGLQEHIHLITAVNCSAKRIVKQGTRKKVFPDRLVARKVRRLGIKSNPPISREVDLRQHCCNLDMLSLEDCV